MTTARAADFVTPIDDVVTPAVADRQTPIVPDHVRLTGYLGGRIDASERNRLMTISEDELLDGFRHRPGKQAWVGEHVGKFLHAATLAWVYSGDAKLRAKIDRVAHELIACQEPDGYLGTYVDRWPAHRGWDVWVHKYDLVGLLTYYRFTGDRASLDACRRIGDLLCDTFGDDAPDKRSIVHTGEHVGMAESSVLEPMVLLYRATGEKKYLAFCHYILRQWELRDGPRIISTLLAGKGVDEVANGKAYEMLSCLNGALELYRTEGDEKLVRAAQLAWQDIASNRLQITGSGSSHERWTKDGQLPIGDAKDSETCVTVTWMQLNLQLLRLTGDAKYADELERSIYNHLLAAQAPNGADWCYYTELEGTKKYDAQQTCCHSSGPRGLALVPTFAYATDADGVVVNLYEPGTASLTMRNGSAVKLEQATRFPSDGAVGIVVRPSSAKRSFAVKLRIPKWAGEVKPVLNGEAVAAPVRAGYAVITRTWADGDRIELKFDLTPREIRGSGSTEGKIAFVAGPVVLAAEPDAPVQSGSALERTEQGWRLRGPPEVDFIPFADAGADGRAYRVWFPAP